MYHKAADVVCVSRSTGSTSSPGGARALALLSSRPPGRFVGKETLLTELMVKYYAKKMNLLCRCC